MRGSKTSNAHARTTIAWCMQKCEAARQCRDRSKPALGQKNRIKSQEVSGEGSGFSSMNFFTIGRWRL